MDKPVLAVVGAGPQIGMSMARRWGGAGYRVALIARSRERLDGFVRELAGLGIESAAFAADVCNRPQLAAAMADALARFGRVDALGYSPLIDMSGLRFVLDMSVQDVMAQMDFQLYGAMTAVQAVAGGMLERGSGALFFTTGASALAPFPSHANGSLGVTALRQYAHMLNVALGHRGVYAGTVCISAPHRGDDIAELYWDMAARRDRVEEVFGGAGIVQAVAAYEEMIWCRGFARTYPPKLLGEPPAPASEAERRKLLMGLYHLRNTACLNEDPAAETARIEALVRRHGGQVDAPFFGVDVR